MKLLLCNDDGVFAPGIAALAAELKKTYDIAIAAPERERSGASHCMTYDLPLRAKRVTLPGLEEVPAFSVSGTPADCVRLACGNLVPDVDLVVSGINRGPNLGTDVFYSGTVAAAMEAVLTDRPGIALSCTGYRMEHLPHVAAVAAKLVAFAIAHPLSGGIFNINIPDLPAHQIKGVKTAGLAMVRYPVAFEMRKDPFGQPYYWSPADVIPQDRTGEDTDARWVREGYITVTPIRYDIADYETMTRMRPEDFVL